MQMGICVPPLDYGKDCLLIHAKLVPAGQAQQHTQRTPLRLGGAGL